MSNKKTQSCSRNIVKILWIQKKYVSLHRQSSELARAMAGDRHNEKTLS